MLLQYRAAKQSITLAKLNQSGSFGMTQAPSGDLCLAVLPFVHSFGLFHFEACSFCRFLSFDVQHRTAVLGLAGYIC